MFKKILIANRGEIACRIIETAHKMGIKTVAIYSDADANAKHVDMAGEAWRVGPPAVAESYLLSDKIIEIAKCSGAEAIHPGYGFLSENPDFVEKIEDSGLRFIGPSADAIRAMGLKDSAKNLMEAAGVPVVPGYHGENQEPEFLASEALKVGYPVLIKARAGGGGKGMRKVDHPDDFAEALAGAQREGLSSFGDASCLIEKWVTTPRHIEIQVFGDDFGNVVHLFERDCSLQRRHQKVIEEAPAPGMTEEMRAAMGDAAVRCAESIGYSGAGTIEFIVDASDGLKPDRFWFMEMNTRLQVEHPVTEAITGVDIVEWQIRVANGEKLPKDQDSLTINGHAFEARIYAENVPAGFLPATGTLDHLSFPKEARIDSGIRQGDTITPWYDPMIAKLIVYGKTREVALRNLKYAIDSSQIFGTVTNLNFLSKLCAHNDFSRGIVDTGLIERDYESLIQAGKLKPELWAIAAILAEERQQNLVLSGWHLWSPLERSVVLGETTETRQITVTQSGPHAFTVKQGDTEIMLTLAVSQGCAHVECMDHRYKIDFITTSGEVTLFTEFGAKSFDIIGINNISDAQENTQNTVISPMPGLVKIVNTKIGSDQKKGDTLVVVEAMKMEHTLTAHRDGVIASLLVKEGQQVEAGELLLTFDDVDD